MPLSSQQSAYLRGVHDAFVHPQPVAYDARLPEAATCLHSECQRCRALGQYCRCRKGLSNGAWHMLMLAIKILEKCYRQVLTLALAHRLAKCKTCNHPQNDTLWFMADPLRFRDSSAKTLHKRAQIAFGQQHSVTRVCGVHEDPRHRTQWACMMPLQVAMARRCGRLHGHYTCRGEEDTIGACFGCQYADGPGSEPR